jgi:hypothetical protein
MRDAFDIAKTSAPAAAAHCGVAMVAAPQG